MERERPRDEIHFLCCQRDILGGSVAFITLSMSSLNMVRVNRSQFQTFLLAIFPPAPLRPLRNGFGLCLMRQKFVYAKLSPAAARAFAQHSRKAKGLAFFSCQSKCQAIFRLGVRRSVLRRFYFEENWERMGRAATGIIKEASKEVKSEEINFDWIILCGRVYGKRKFALSRQWKRRADASIFVLFGHRIVFVSLVLIPKNGTGRAAVGGNFLLRFSRFGGGVHVLFNWSGGTAPKTNCLCVPTAICIPPAIFFLFSFFFVKFYLFRSVNQQVRRSSDANPFHFYVCKHIFFPLNFPSKEPAVPERIRRAVIWPKSV